MDHFNYKNGMLHAEEVEISQIARKVGTPFYCYSDATFTRHYRVFSEAFKTVPATICFAVKANSNVAVLRTLAKLGSGADTVSEGEVRRAIAAGVPPAKIVFSGVGKTRQEIRYSLEQDIGQFNVESVEELGMINEVAASMNIKARIAVRVNPDVDAKTHDKITTGRKTDKFGVAWDQVMSVYENAKKHKNIKVVGVATHIGSQLTSLDPFKKAFSKVVDLVTNLRAAGHKIDRLDFGGGLGVPYKEENPPHPAEYADMIIETVKHLKCELVLEPGRLISGNAGILVTSVVLVKNTPERVFVVVDAAMNDLIRPAFYGSYHEIIPAIEPKASEKKTTIDIVGPVCESSDVFGKDRQLSNIKENDLLIMRTAGAYGAVMSSTYNSRLLVPEVMVKGSEFFVIRERPTFDAMIAADKIPYWLK